MGQSAPQIPVCGTAAELAGVVLARNQLGVESDTGLMRLGDGSTAFASLTSFPTTSKTGTGATGSRPSASTVGAGAQWYDTTLSKPIWSNGTVWKDAAGTTV